MNFELSEAYDPPNPNEPADAEGFIQPLAGGFTSLGFHEVVKYIVNHYFYQLPGTALLNMDYWNKLSPDVRNLLISTTRETEQVVAKYYTGLHEEEIQKAQKAGVTLVNFSKDDAKWFVDAAYRTGWENLLKKAPKYGPKLQEVSTK